MKKLLFLFIICIKLNLLYAQEMDTIPPYQKDSLHIPAFTVLKTDSTYTNDKAVPNDKPVVIIYFSPECGHCQITADEFSRKMKEMKDIFFVWVSYYSLPEVRDFAKKFNLQQFNNIIIARDENYAIPSYYRVKFTPFMALYNKAHHLIKTYPQGTDADTLIKLLKDE
ncbi:TlpA family protein disulfide reductase [Parafilimonas sp.]|uniref:TlpA family protein disulfide reductase n=1 Tax=Parafilimonas sp. TaxID=1969739 RepID=UPI0039E6E7B6